MTRAACANNDERMLLDDGKLACASISYSLLCRYFRGVYTDRRREQITAAETDLKRCAVCGSTFDGQQSGETVPVCGKIRAGRKRKEKQAFTDKTTP